MEELSTSDLISLVSKPTLYICLTIAVCFWVSSCQIRENIIESCKKSCQSYETSMRSVTSRECECFSKGFNSRNDWILPNN